MERLRYQPSPLTLLCVEDEPEAREFIADMISSTYDQLHVVVAENGEEGLEMFRRLAPDIVLSDISMPCMNGIRMAEEIRKVSPKAQIILMSAYSDARYMLDAIKLRISRYILKPIDSDLLFEAIDEAIGQIHLERQVKSQDEFIRKLSRAVEQSPGVVVITDTNGTIEYVNPKFTELTGYGKDEAVGQNPRILRSGLTPTKTHESLWSTIKAGQEWRGEFLNRKKNGDLYRELASISPIFDDEGEITHFVAVKEDITELRRMMEQVETLNTDLSAKASELEDLNERLKASNVELEMSNLELEAFSHTASHDLRAPLSNIKGIASFLEEVGGQAMDEQGREFLGLIHQEVDRMMNLISALLNFSRIKTQELSPQEVDLSSICEGVIAGFRLNEPERSVKVSITDGAVTRGDPVLLHSVLENLLGNAWKYTRKKGEATIEFDVSCQNGRRVFVVRDNGAGFRPEDAVKLFTPFQRLHRGADFEGNGVGLATVSRIIQRHAGEIWAEGEPEKGAAFFFTLGTDSEILDYARGFLPDRELPAIHTPEG